MKKLIVLFLMLAVILSACGKAQSTPKCWSDSTGTFCVTTPTPDLSRPIVPTVDDTVKNAWYACTLFIQRQLKVSTSDAQRYTSSGVTSSGNQYTVEIFYAKTSSKYQCVMDRHANGDFQLTELNLVR